MITAGIRQKLYIVKKVSFGVYLAEHPPGAEAAKTQEEVLLPMKEAGEDAKPGDLLDVFVYLDSEDRPIATQRQPKITLHGVERLVCRQTTKIGAFMDWGLEKDVLLPYAEQTAAVREGDEVLCALYTDKSGRLALTMNVYPYLRTDSPYLKDMQVSGTVYETSTNFGAFVAVDDCYSALIPKSELYEEVRIGTRIQARVADIREDGKLTLALRKKAYLQMDEDAEKLLDAITKRGGSLPLGDKSPAEEIKRIMHMSKAQFKRAAGRLYKEGRITMTERSLSLLPGDEK